MVRLAKITKNRPGMGAHTIYKFYVYCEKLDCIIPSY